MRGGRTVQELQDALALDQPIVSQQLAVLRNQDRRGAEEGSSVRYTLRDPLVGDLLDVARRIFNNHLVNTPGAAARAAARRPSTVALGTRAVSPTPTLLASPAFVPQSGMLTPDTYRARRARRRRTSRPG